MPTVLGFLLVGILFASLPMRVAAQCGVHWQSGGGYSGADGIVETAVEWDPDGVGPQPSLGVVGGRFTVVSDQIANHIAVHDSVTDTWANLGSGTDGPVFALAAQANGGLVAAGTFVHAGGIVANNLARWNGSSWQSIGGGTNGSVYAVAELANGDLVIGGDFTTAGGVAASRIARWDGISWSAFGGGADGVVRALAVSPVNGDLIVGGDFTRIGSLTTALRVAKWNGAWTNLGSIATRVDSIAVMATGEPVAVGPSFGPARWDGSSWLVFTAGIAAPNRAWFVRRLPTGDLIAGIVTIFFNGLVAVCRWNGSTWVALAYANGQPLVQFQYSGIRAVAQTAQGDLLIGGDFVAPERRLFRAAGSQTHPVGGAIGSACIGIDELPSGEVIVTDGKSVRRRDSSGAWWPFWSAFSWQPIRGIGALTTGQALVGSSFSTVWYNPWGTPSYQYYPAATVSPTTNPVYVSSWLQSSPCDGYEINRLSSGKLALAVEGLTWPVGVFVFNPSGSVAAYSFIQYRSIRTVAGHDSGDLYASTRYGNAVLKETGTAVAIIGTADAPTRTLLVTSAGELFAGGGFTTMNGVACSRIARWDGTNWHPLGAGTNGPVNAMVELPNGDVLVGGEFSTAGGIATSNLARWDGNTWSSIPDGPNGAVTVMKRHSAGAIWVGGDFSIAGGLAAGCVAILETTCPASAVPYGAGCTGSGGLNTLSAVSLPWLGQVFRSRAAGMPASGFVVVALGMAPLGLPLPQVLPFGVPGCDLLTTPDRLELDLPVAGVADIDVALPVTVVVNGQTIHQQAFGVELDAVGTITSLTSTNALRLTIGTW